MSLLGFIGKTVGGFLTGGPLGAVAAHVVPLIAKTGLANAPTSQAAGVLRQITSGMPVLKPSVNIATAYPPRQVVGPGMPPMLPDSSRTSGVSLGPLTIGSKTNYYPTAPGGAAGAPPGCQKGYHLNKTGYYTKAQGWVPEGSRCVKNRRRNPLNPRALSRSIARISSAKNAAKFLGRVTVREKGCN